MTDREIFMNSPAGATPEVLEAYLDKMCGEDAELRARVEELLTADSEVDTNFLEIAPGGLGSGAAAEEATLQDDAPIAEGEGATIGNYKLLQQIGEGGFGVVFMAEQLRPVRRRVALKIIKLGMDTRQVVARFEAERQALALMDHPHIATVLDAGATRLGRPYFVMELVQGVPITEFCREHRMSTDQRLDLFLEVCSAIQHAHQKGIIHRDIKPSNILVGLHGDRPVPKVIDFGIAKATQQPLTEKTLVTSIEQLVGTPAYMSPEQASQSFLDIDTRSDIYSLGVLLYELLAGTPPFDSKSLLSAGAEEMRRIIREEDPPKPSVRLSTVVLDPCVPEGQGWPVEPRLLGKALRGDLDWIVMKSIDKDRTRRYETANALAQDLRRHLRNEPVIAAAPSVGYKVRKFIRRNRSSVTVAAIITILLVAGIAATSWSAFVAGVAKGEAVEALAMVESQKLQIESSLSQARVAEAEAKAADRKSRELLYATDMQLAPFVWEDENATGPQFRSLLDAHGPEQNGAFTAREDLRGFEWYYYNNLLENSASLFGDRSGTEVSDCAMTSDGYVVTLEASGRMRHWSVGTRHENESLRRELPAGRDARQRLLSPNGQFAALARERDILVFNTSDGRELCRIASEWGPYRHVIFSHSGAMLVVVDDQLRVCGTRDGKVLARLSLDRKKGHRAGVCLSSDGGTLALVGHNPKEGAGLGECFSVYQLDRSSGTITPLSSDVRFDATLSGGALNNDGSLIAVGTTLSGALAVFDTTAGKLVASHPAAHSSPISAISFSNSGSQLASGDVEGTIKLWGEVGAVSDGSPAHMVLKGHRSAVARVSFSADGQKLISNGHEKSARVWDLRYHERGARLIEGQRSRNFMTRFSPDGLMFATADRNGSVWLRDSADGTLLRELATGHRHRVHSIAFSPRDLKLLAVGYGETMEASFISLWDIDAGVELERLPGAGKLKGFRFNGLTGTVGALAFSPDGKHLAAGFGHPYFYNPEPDPSPLIVWDVDSRREVSRLDGHMNYCRALKFSPDGSLLVSGSRDGTIRFWSTSTWQEARSPLRNPDAETSSDPNAGRVEALAISPDGKSLAMASGGGGVMLFNMQTGKMYEALEGHSTSVMSVEFSPDGGTLASGGSDQTVRLWNVKTRRELLQLSAGGLKLGEIWALAFSPDGAHLVAGGTRTAIWPTKPTIWSDSDRLGDKIELLGRSEVDIALRLGMFSRHAELPLTLRSLARDKPEFAWVANQVDARLEEGKRVRREMEKKLMALTGHWFDLNGGEIEIEYREGEIIARAMNAEVGRWWSTAIGVALGKQIKMTHFKGTMQTDVQVGRISKDSSRIDWSNGTHWKRRQGPNPPPVP